MAQLLFILSLLLFISGLLLSQKLMRIDSMVYGIFLGSFTILFFPFLNLLIQEALEVPWWLIVTKTNKFNNIKIENHIESLLLLLIIQLIVTRYQNESKKGFIKLLEIV